MKSLIFTLVLTLFVQAAYSQEQKAERLRPEVKAVETVSMGLTEMEGAEISTKLASPEILAAVAESDGSLTEGLAVSEGPMGVELDIIKNLPKDAWNLIKSPLGWDKNEWFVAAGVTTVTALLISGDKRIMEFFQNNKSELTEEIAHVAEKGGSDGVVYGLAATYITGAIIKNKKLKQAALTAFSSMLVSGLLVQGLKNIFGRSRPYTNNGSEDFNAFCFCGSDNSSFPSGHTTSAFSTAAVISTFYNKPLVKILAYTAASLTGLSRIHDRAHWASDVFLGAIFGHFSGKFLAKEVLKRNSDTQPAIQASPTVLNVGGQQAYGVGVKADLGKLFGGKKRRKNRN